MIKITNIPINIITKIIMQLTMLHLFTKIIENKKAHKGAIYKSHNY